MYKVRTSPHSHQKVLRGVLNTLWCGVLMESGEVYVWRKDNLYRKPWFWIYNVTCLIGTLIEYLEGLDE